MASDVRGAIEIHREQHEFNVTGWAELVADRKLGAMPNKPAPEICIEILSLDNTGKEIREKPAIYFEAGAHEVWICDLEGKMRFLSQNADLSASTLFPELPKLISTYPEKLALG